MILTVQDNIYNLAHDGVRDVNFLGTVHFDDDVSDIIRLHERLVGHWVFLVHQRPIHCIRQVGRNGISQRLTLQSSNPSR